MSSRRHSMIGDSYSHQKSSESIHRPELSDDEITSSAPWVTIRRRYSDVSPKLSTISRRKKPSQKASVSVEYKTNGGITSDKLFNGKKRHTATRSVSVPAHNLLRRSDRPDVCLENRLTHSSKRLVHERNRRRESFCDVSGHSSGIRCRGGSPQAEMHSHSCSPFSITPPSTVVEKVQCKETHHTTLLKEQLRIESYSIELGPVIGRGGFSSVYSVSDLVSNKKYALKVVSVSEDVQNEIRTSLLKEVKIMQSLINVDHVIQLLAHDVAASNDKILILMELGQGDLRQIMSSCIEKSKSLDIDFIRYWGGQILNAVDAIHRRNIVHSDLKPANFIVVNGSLKLCDFGIANPVPENATSIHRSNAIGTLLYMAPECLQRTNDSCSGYKVNKASDIWACGVILYEMVYQQYPFQAHTYLYKAENSELEEVEHPKTTPANSPVPLALHEVIRDCLHLVPSKRISSRAAAKSVFFSPVSVDLEAVVSMTRNIYKYCHQQYIQNPNHTMSPEKLQDLAKALYQRLQRFNNGN